MGLLLHLAAASVTTPSPTPSIDPDLVTPGAWGFVAIAFIALAVVGLLYDMLRRIRRAKYRSEVNEDLDAEEREQRGEGPDPAQP